MRDPNTEPTSRDGLPVASFAMLTVGAIAAVKLAAHVAVNAWGPYEFHRDEFLYFAMGDHLRLFSMDFPPFIAMLSETVRATLGDSLSAIRLTPALAGTALVILAALTARLLGGRRFAQGFAAFSAVASLLFLRSANLFQPVVFDQLWWTLALMSLLMLGKTGKPRWWIAFGAAVGIGLLTKFSILILGFATFLALLATQERRWLKSRWPWIAAAIALVLGSPSIIGQITLGWPVVGQMENLSTRQLGRITYLGFIKDQALLHGGMIVAVVGAWTLAFGRRWRTQRLLGATTIVAFLTLMLLQGKSYYIGPIYPVLFGAGAVVFEGLGGAWGRVVRWGTVTVMAAYLVLLLPLGLPMLKPPTMERYLKDMGLQMAAKTNVGAQERIPQDYADMLGWKEQTEAVAKVYRDLSAQDQEKTVILASNYGEAGALEFYGPRYGLPPPVSFVGSYWFFGPGELPGDIVITVGFEPDEVDDFFGSVEPARTVRQPFAVEEERRVRITVGRNPKTTLQAFWPTVKGAH